MKISKAGIIFFVAITLLLVWVIFAKVLPDAKETGSKVIPSTTATARTPDPIINKKSNADKVAYIAQRQINYDRDEKEFRFQFSFLDADKKEIAAGAVVTMYIKNDKNETVYKNTFTITENNFSTWTYSFTGASYYLATIRIKQSDISAGSSSAGTIYFTISNEGHFFFPESKLTISQGLPLKETVVQLPEVSKIISYYDIFGRVYYSCNVTAISYKVVGNNLYLYFDLEKIYDARGNDYSDYCLVAWKLYDENNYVVDSGTYFSNNLTVGEKIKNGQDYSFNSIEPGKTYRLEIVDVK